MRLISWPNGKRYSCPMQCFLASLLLSLASTLLFFRTGGVLSHLNTSTHRFPRFPLRNLCSLVMLAECSLSSLLQRLLLTVKLFISLGLAESRIFHAALADTCSRTPLISFCTVQLRILRADSSLATLSLYDLWSRPWRVYRLLGLHGLPPSAHPLEGVR